MRRVLVLGSGGAGKSTFARQLARRLQLPVIHLDAFFWQSGWVQASLDEFDAALGRALDRDGWVMDGNYTRTLPRRAAVCDTIVFLDIAPAICVWRLLKRRLLYAGKTRPDMPDRCPERLDWEFLIWVWTYPRHSRPQILECMATLRRDQRAVTLRTSTDIENFLNQFPS